MKRQVVTLVATFILSVLSAHILFAAEAHRYAAVFSDGARLEGNQLHRWNDRQSVPTLEGVSLIDPGNPVRWLRDRRLREKAYQYFAASFVEFVGGDRLPGKVTGAGFETAGGTASCLLVDTEGAFAHPGGTGRKYFRVLPSKVQRIVWRGAKIQALTPGFAYLRSGRPVEFRRLRWGQGFISLLLKDGVKEFSFAELDEIHPFTDDPWEIYYNDIAVLSPGLDGLLFRIETVDGLVATASRPRSHAVSFQSLQERERYSRIRASLEGQLKNFDRNNTASLAKIDALEKKVGEELKSRSEKPGGSKKVRPPDKAGRVPSDLDRRYQRRLETHDRLTANLEKSRLLQLEKLPEEERKAQLDAFRKDRRDQRKQIVQQHGEEASRVRERRLQQEKRRIYSRRVLSSEQIDRFSQAASGARLIAAVDGYNNWLGAMERVRERAEMLREERGTPDTWQHMVQPAWSLDPIWTPFNRIHSCSFFRPEELQLSRLYPAAFKERHYLAKSAGWRVDRNSRNAFLSSANRGYGWGYSVHAYNELHFELGPLVTSFRSRLGLDSQVGDGGCVVGRVFLGSMEGEPLYQSPFLVGSYQTVDTGRLVLPLQPAGSRRLILQADTAHAEEISAVDPFDIRDMVDWLEPMLELDRNRLAEVVRDRVHLNVPVWRDWNPMFSPGATCEWKVVLESRGEESFFSGLELRGAPLLLSRKLQPTAGRRWLEVDVGEAGSLLPDPSILTVRIDGKELEPAALPRRQPWQAGSIPLLYDLGINNESPATVEISQKPGRQLVCWRRLAIANRPSAVYELSTLLEASGGRDLKLTRAIAQVVRSSRLGFEEKKAALQLYQRGAEINYSVAIPPGESKLVGRKDLWKATASHNNTDPSTGPLRAFDKNPSSRWTSIFSQQPGMWFTIEFPGPTFLGGIRLMTPGSNDHPDGYEIYASMDGARWSGVLAKGAGTSPLTAASFAPVEGRFLRIVQTGKKSLWWSIHEIEVLQPATVDVVSSILLGENWRGTDGDLSLLKKLSTLQSVYFSGQSPNSADARLALRQSLGAVAFKENRRLPSISGPVCEFKVTNKTKKTIKLIWVGMKAEDVPRPDLVPGQSWVCRSYVGHRWEARVDGHRVSFYVVEPGFDWDVENEQ